MARPKLPVPEFTDISEPVDLQPSSGKTVQDIHYRKAAKNMFPLKTRWLNRQRSCAAKGDEQGVNEARKQRLGLLQKSEAKEWRVQGVTVDRYTCMKWILEKVSEGKLISEICSGTNGMPSMMTIQNWKKMHPAFNDALKNAKEIRAEVLADEALTIVRQEDDKNRAGLVKVKHDALMKRASLESTAFQEKHVVQTQALDDQSDEQLQQRLSALLKTNPHLLPPDWQAALNIQPEVKVIEREEVLDE